MPRALPDAVGLAVRIPPWDGSERSWDVLLVSAGSGVLGRAIGLRPVTSWTAQSMSSLMPLRYQGRNWWLRARITTDINGSGLALNDLRDQIDSGGIQVQLDQACGAEDFRALGRLTLTGSMVGASDGDVSFDPVHNTAPRVSLYPAWLADLRGSAYARSREGRTAAADTTTDPAGQPARSVALSRTTG
jgi:hypothetical protein